MCKVMEDRRNEAAKNAKDRIDKKHKMVSRPFVTAANKKQRTHSTVNCLTVRNFMDAA